MLMFVWPIKKNVKPNYDIYKSPLDFYLKNSLEVCSEIRADNENLSAVKITWVIYPQNSLEIMEFCVIISGDYTFTDKVD